MQSRATESIGRGRAGSSSGRAKQRAKQEEEGTMKTLVWLSALWLLVSPASARDLEDILKDKGVLSPVEANEAKAAKEKEQAATEKAVSAIPSLPEWVKMVTLSGDVRIRNESFFQSGTTDRIRQRFRLRFGAKVKPSDELEIAFKLASGNPDDPISNNQTFSDTFTFKDINIANAYIKLTPMESIGLERDWVTLMGGKFEVPMYKVPGPTQLVYDNDLTPEGFFEGLKAVDEKDGFLRGLSVNLGQWIIQEKSNSGESAIYAFQGLGTMAFGDMLLNLAVSDYKYNDPDSIAQAKNSNSSLFISNFTELSDGTIVGGKSVSPSTDAEGNPITLSRLVSGFNDLVVGGDLLIPTPDKRFPVRVFAGYVRNTEANTSADQGYKGGFTIGSTKNPGDITFSYQYEYLETDAMISAFSDSDLGRSGGTNTKANILQAGYVLTKHLSLLSTAWIDKPINNVSGRNSNTDYRWQVDVLAKF
jgi:Putative porin